MIVAIDAECLSSSGTDPLELYAHFLARLLTGPAPSLEKVVILTNAANHGRFEPLRDERCDIAMVVRPLFEGRPVADWTALLTRAPRAGADLLAEHQQQKLRIMGQTGASVVHFPTDAHEVMEMDTAVVVSIHQSTSVPLSALLADAIVLDGPQAAADFAAQRVVSPQRTFVVPWLEPSSESSSKADKHTEPQRTAVAALGEAYEHALASFELRKAA